jgi:AraC-like DNA-binding protein/quercetin dioxygenase-like cupin family protein
MLDETAALEIRRGYLNENFKYFHLRDKKDMEFEFHYHDFNKIIIFISGTVTYLIEGKAYKLKPWDIIFVTSNDIHKVIVDAYEPYERIVIWINSKFLELHNNDCNLLSCFELSSKKRRNLLRLNLETLKGIKPTLFFLENAIKDKGFGSEVLSNTFLLQLMVYLNRLFLGSNMDILENDIDYDERIGNILDYINSNLHEELSIDNIALKFYISKYYLMHKFKAQTGYTVHNYVQQKRLIKAAALIKKGNQISSVYLECGFGDYSNFERAFKREFGLSPKKYYKIITDLESSYNKNNHISQRTD